MSQPCRLAGGGFAIDRSRPLSFSWNGRRLSGYAGDTLASALLANGVHLVARSFKYHRPRGIMSAGSEEPNAMVQVGEGGRSTPNIKATELMLYDGLVASGINAWPSVDFDIGATARVLSHFMPAGFYYKAFFGSQFLWERLYEPLIRRAGGWGRVPDSPDPDRYERTYHHCDVLVVGAGPAGMTAALSAAAGALVTIADEKSAVGAYEVREREKPAGRWISNAGKELRNATNITFLPRTTVFGYYDNNCLAAIQRLAEPGELTGGPRERLWHFRAGRVILATGAHERPLVFGNNDRPGIMLAGAVREYIDRWGVLPGRRAILFTNNDRAYDAALALVDAGAAVIVVDARNDPSGPRAEAASKRGVAVRSGSVVVDTRGGRRVSSAAVATLKESRIGEVEWLGCDLLAVSGGYSPAVHLHSQAQGALEYDEIHAGFRPSRVPPSGPADSSRRDARASVGACNGTFDLRAALEEARNAGRAAAGACGFEANDPIELPRIDDPPWSPPAPFRRVPCTRRSGERSQFVDLQNDTTVADLRLALDEGFEAVEHAKRYTLTGFGTDQGKTSNINALGILSELMGKPIACIGTTTFRPPYTPVTFAAMGGRDRGELFDPARLTAIHDRHVAAGAEFEDVGQWKRPWYYPRPGEDMHAAVGRECRAVRERVGMLDASTLGKIDIQGPDSAEFLNRVYTNDWLDLPIGKVRYGIMCREDGMLFDDGTTARIGEYRYFMTTTTGNAAAVLEHLEEYLQTEWSGLRVRLTSATEQWATVGVAGPMSRKVLEKLAPDTDFSGEAFPFLAWREATIGGVAARIFRISFTGELQYEINVPWHYGASLWNALTAAGEEFGITPYGTEAMHVLRAEKGFIIVGQETDGTQTPLDLGFGRAVSDRKDFIGRRSMARSDCLRPDRKQLVGLLPEDPDAELPEGTHLVKPGRGGDPPPVPMEGFVTSSYLSPALGGRFCLALVKGGRQRHGEVVEAAIADRRGKRSVRVRICSPVFYDRKGARRDGE